MSGRPAFASLQSAISPVAATVRILAADQSVSTLLDRENLAALQTTLKLGLPAFEGKFAAPPGVPFEFFERLELEVAEPSRGAFMDAAVAYSDYARDAQDLLALAELARTNGAGPVAATGYLERAVPELEGCAKALRTIVPLLPGR